MGKHCQKCGHYAESWPSGDEAVCPRCAKPYVDGAAESSAAIAPPPPAADGTNRKPTRILDSGRRTIETTGAPTTDAVAFPNPANGVSVVLLLIGGALAFLVGLGAWAFGASAIHQILSAVFFLIATVCLAALGIVRAVAKSATSVRSEIRKAAIFIAADNREALEATKAPPERPT